MRHNEGERQKNPIKRVWERITRRGRSEPTPERSPLVQPLLRYVEEQERVEQEAAAREREQQRQRQERERREQKVRQRQEAAEEGQREQKRRSEARREQKTCLELARDIQQLGLDTYAEIVQKRLWKNSPVRVDLTEINKPDVIVNDDGTDTNRSQVGRKLSYSYFNGTYEVISHTQHADEDDHEGFTVTDNYPQTSTEELSFGIGYFFGDRATILRDAQPFVSDEEVGKGVKGYFIKQVNAGIYGKEGQKRIEKNYVFPVAYPQSQQVFGGMLFEIAMSRSPKKVAIFGIP